MAKAVALFFIVVLCGCVAVVDDRGSERKIKAYGTTAEDIEDTLRKADTKNPESKTEYIIFEQEK